MKYRGPKSDLSDPTKYNKLTDLSNFEVKAKTTPCHAQLTADPSLGRKTLCGRREDKTCNFQLGALFGKAIRNRGNKYTREGSIKGVEKAKAEIITTNTNGWTLEHDSMATNVQNDNKAQSRLLRELLINSEEKVPPEYSHIFEEALFIPDSTPDKILGQNLCFTMKRFKEHLLKAREWLADATFDLVAPFKKSKFRQLLVLCIKEWVIYFTLTYSVSL